MLSETLLSATVSIFLLHIKGIREPIARVGIDRVPYSHTRKMTATIDLEPIARHLDLVASIAFIHTTYGNIMPRFIYLQLYSIESLYITFNQ